MFIPADVKLDRNRLHEAMGLHANLKKTADEGKFNKYLKRMCAMYRHASWGTESSLKDDMMIYRSEGARWRVRWNSQPMQGNKIPMPDHPDLTSDNIRSIVEFIKSEASAAPEAAPFNKPGKLRPVYTPLSITNYGFFIGYLAVVVLLIIGLLMAVKVKSMERNMRRNQ
jgi:hypothetical protein